MSTQSCNDRSTAKCSAAATDSTNLEVGKSSIATNNFFCPNTLNRKVLFVVI